ncbi:putative uncharacterized protein DDB_G0282133 [Hydra vulgaris]|uniref:putative uncharacterized protein DDB_G0282133 n=1 Tax=Hydra vulgaris TaxID=6087 RepID=UPI001F5E43D9|nr:putative uncharacterized protein DDB_G0282133 [Hydra vulgaris]
MYAIELLLLFIGLVPLHSTAYKTNTSSNILSSSSRLVNLVQDEPFYISTSRSGKLKLIVKRSFSLKPGNNKSSFSGQNKSLVSRPSKLNKLFLFKNKIVKNKETLLEPKLDTRNFDLRNDSRRQSNNFRKGFLSKNKKNFSNRMYLKDFDNQKSVLRKNDTKIGTKITNKSQLKKRTVDSKIWEQDLISEIISNKPSLKRWDQQIVPIIDETFETPKITKFHSTSSTTKQLSDQSNNHINKRLKQVSISQKIKPKINRKSSTSVLKSCIENGQVVIAEGCGDEIIDHSSLNSNSYVANLLRNTQSNRYNMENVGVASKQQWDANDNKQQWISNDIKPQWDANFHNSHSLLKPSVQTNGFFGNFKNEVNTELALAADSKDKAIEDATSIEPFQDLSPSIHSLSYKLLNALQDDPTLDELEYHSENQPKGWPMIKHGVERETNNGFHPTNNLNLVGEVHKDFHEYPQSPVDILGAYNPLVSGSLLKKPSDYHFSGALQNPPGYRFNEVNEKISHTIASNQKVSTANHNLDSKVFSSVGHDTNTIYMPTSITSSSNMHGVTIENSGNPHIWSNPPSDNYNYHNQLPPSDHVAFYDHNHVDGSSFNHHEIDHSHDHEIDRNHDHEINRHHDHEDNHDHEVDHSHNHIVIHDHESEHIHDQQSLIQNFDPHHGFNENHEKVGIGTDFDSQLGHTYNLGGSIVHAMGDPFAGLEYSFNSPILNHPSGKGDNGMVGAIIAAGTGATSGAVFGLGVPFPEKISEPMFEGDSAVSVKLSNQSPGSENNKSPNNKTANDSQSKDNQNKNQENNTGNVGKDMTVGGNSTTSNGNNNNPNESNGNNNKNNGKNGGSSNGDGSNEKNINTPDLKGSDNKDKNNMGASSNSNDVNNGNNNDPNVKNQNNNNPNESKENSNKSNGKNGSSNNADESNEKNINTPELKGSDNKDKNNMGAGNNSNDVNNKASSNKVETNNKNNENNGKSSNVGGSNEKNSNTPELKGSDGKTQDNIANKDNNNSGSGDNSKDGNSSNVGGSNEKNSNTPELKGSDDKTQDNLINKDQNNKGSTDKNGGNNKNNGSNGSVNNNGAVNDENGKGNEDTAKDNSKTSGEGGGLVKNEANNTNLSKNEKNGNSNSGTNNVPANGNIGNNKGGGSSNGGSNSNGQDNVNNINNSNNGANGNINSNGNDGNDGGFNGRTGNKENAGSSGGNNNSGVNGNSKDNNYGRVADNSRINVNNGVNGNGGVNGNDGINNNGRVNNNGGANGNEGINGNNGINRNDNAGIYSNGEVNSNNQNNNNVGNNVGNNVNRGDNGDGRYSNNAAVLSENRISNSEGKETETNCQQNVQVSQNAANSVNMGSNKIDSNGQYANGGAINEKTAVNGVYSAGNGDKNINCPNNARIGNFGNIEENKMINTNINGGKSQEYANNNEKIENNISNSNLGCEVVAGNCFHEKGIEKKQENFNGNSGPLNGNVNINVDSGGIKIGIGNVDIGQSINAERFKGLSLNNNKGGNLNEGQQLSKNIGAYENKDAGGCYECNNLINMAGNGISTTTNFRTFHRAENNNFNAQDSRKAGSRRDGNVNNNHNKADEYLVAGINSYIDKNLGSNLNNNGILNDATNADNNNAINVETNGGNNEVMNAGSSASNFRVLNFGGNEPMDGAVSLDKNKVTNLDTNRVKSLESDIANILNYNKYNLLEGQKGNNLLNIKNNNKFDDSKDIRINTGGFIDENRGHDMSNNKQADNHFPNENEKTNIAVNNFVNGISAQNGQLFQNFIKNENGKGNLEVLNTGNSCQKQNALLTGNNYNTKCSTIYRNVDKKVNFVNPIFNNQINRNFGSNKDLTKFNGNKNLLKENTLNNRFKNRLNNVAFMVGDSGSSLHSFDGMSGGFNRKGVLCVVGTEVDCNNVSKEKQTVIKNLLKSNNQLWDNSVRAGLPSGASAISSKMVEYNTGNKANSNRDRNFYSSSDNNVQIYKTGNNEDKKNELNSGVPTNSKENINGVDINRCGCNKFISADKFCSCKSIKPMELTLKNSQNSGGNLTHQFVKFFENIAEKLHVNELVAVEEIVKNFKNNHQNLTKRKLNEHMENFSNSILNKNARLSVPETITSVTSAVAKDRLPTPQEVFNNNFSPKIKTIVET